MRTDPRIEKTLLLWHQYAGELGVDPSDFQHDLLWQKNEKWRSHVVLKMDGPEHAYVIKKKFSGQSIKDGLKAQENAREAIKNHPVASVPKVHFVNDEDQFCIMDFFDGRPITSVLEEPSNKNQYLRLMGEFCHALHSGTALHGERTFQPKFMMNYIKRVIARLEAGEWSVAEKSMFLRCANKIPNIAEKYEDQRTHSAQLHGDLNVRNLLFEENKVAAFDFKPLDFKPVGYDISRLLVDFTELYVTPSDLQSGRIVPEQVNNSFFESYTFRNPDDPSISFLPFTRLLEDWLQIPTIPAERSVRQEFRLENILQIAEVGFEI